MVAVNDGSVTAILYPPSNHHTNAALILAHGAGAGQRSPFMVAFADAMADRGIAAVTFNFPYTEHRRRVPDRAPVLEACYVSVLHAVRERLGQHTRIFIGGKSMGGRMATHIAAADRTLPIAGLVLLGYPLHPPGRPTQLRDAHLPSVGRAALFVQGSRDTFGTPAELAPVLARMSPAPTLHVVEGGDHSFKVSSAKAKQDGVITGVQDAVAAWITARQ